MPDATRRGLLRGIRRQNRVMPVNNRLMTARTRESNRLAPVWGGRKAAPFSPARQGRQPAAINPAAQAADLSDEVPAFEMRAIAGEVVGDHLGQGFWRVAAAANGDVAALAH